mmetsp:Transcript_1915/g.2359  ORF Transcript_1915/g.2359 Transcript_1915/m.2359 type:complete len:276 (+) Transcript_1915:140-967(+)|eukprot:jgi/Bigna1/89055/estExt_fgenesh1_pg.C_430025
MESVAILSPQLYESLQNFRRSRHRSKSGNSPILPMDLRSLKRTRDGNQMREGQQYRGHVQVEKRIRRTPIPVNELSTTTIMGRKCSQNSNEGKSSVIVMSLPIKHQDSIIQKYKQGLHQVKNGSNDKRDLLMTPAFRPSSTLVSGHNLSPSLPAKPKYGNLPRRSELKEGSSKAMLVSTTTSWMNCSTTPPSTPSLEENFDSSLTTGATNSNESNDGERGVNPALDLVRDDSLSTEPTLSSEDDIDLLFDESNLENSDLNVLMGDEIGKPGIALY